VEAAEVPARAAGPGLPGKKAAVAERAAAVLSAGGEVWVGDETALREFPPLRAAWARVGQQAAVVISGRNARRVIHGMLNVASGEVVRLVRERGRGSDCAAALAVLGQRRPTVPKLLVWDNAPPHHTHAARAAAALAAVELAWLPFRSPELNPCEDLWRHLKTTVAANRVYDSVDTLAEHAINWLDDLEPSRVLHLAGLQSRKFDWLPT
jgi:transposase